MRVLLQLASRRPRRQLLAADLGVVADVDGEAGWQQEVLRCFAVCTWPSPMCAQLVGDALVPVVLDAWRELDAQHRPLRAARADADQRGAAHVGMRVEHRLDLLGAQRRRASVTTRCDLRPQNHSRPFAIEIAEVAHAMHDAFAAVGQRLADLRQRGRGVAAEVACRWRSGRRR